MPFRRRSKKIHKTLRASRAACEHLESRRLITAVRNGVFVDTNTIYDGSSTFVYRQANGDFNIKISVVGNITAEFIGAIADEIGTGFVELRDLLPDTAPPLVPATATTPALNVSTFLFGIYIVSADLNSAISIAQVPIRPIPPAIPIPRPMDPFGPGVPMRTFRALTVGGDATNQVITTPTDGGVYLGAQTGDAAPLLVQQQNIPLIWSSQSSFGMRPASAGEMFAGIETAPGVSIGKIFIGGTVTGIVDIKGSIDTFYAGNILTGDASGISNNGNQSDLNGLNIGHFPRNNFSVGGDIRQLLSANSFGTFSMNNLATTRTDLTAQLYKTGFQLSVAGRAGYVFANDSYSGQLTVRNLTTVAGPGTAIREVEFIGPTILDQLLPDPGPDMSANAYFDPEYHGIDMSIGADTPDVRFLNDTFDTAQWLGTSFSQAMNSVDAIQVRGSLNNLPPGVILATPIDPIDFYAVPLLAGQTIEIQLRNFPVAGQNPNLSPRLGILDPRGRVVATDYSNVSENSRVGKVIRFTAKLPGSYRIAVGNGGDINFNGAVDAGERTRFIFNANPYEIRITNAGSLALGGLIVNQHVGTMDQASNGIQVLRGDLGEIRAGLGIAGTTQGQGQVFSMSNPWYVPVGHLRAIEAFSIGVSGATVVWHSGPELLVRKGNIGLLRTTGAGLNNTLAINDNSPFNTDPVLFPTWEDDLSLTSATRAVGMSIQVVEAAGVVTGAYLANRGIGVIRTQQLGGIDQTNTGSLLFQSDVGGGNNIPEVEPVIQVNVDNLGSDGIIDLIDVSLNAANTVSVYGAAITTGPNGNVRYFHVGNLALVTPDPEFGAGGPQQATLYDPGEIARVTDDSGARVVLTPIPRVRNPLFPLPTGALDLLDPPQLTVMTYPIRGKSGTAILRVTVVQNNDPLSDGVTDINRPGGGGVHVQASANGVRSSAEIGEIDISLTPATSTSNPITFDPFDRVYIPTLPPVDPNLVIRPLDLIFEGNTNIDVYNILATAAQTINSIQNVTTGEILNVTGTPDVVTFGAQTIGIAKSSTGAAVEGILQRNTVQPFTDQRVLIDLGDVQTIRARGAMGNIQAINIATIQANADSKNTSGGFEGFAAPIVARGAGSELIGNIVLAQIGEGVASSGSGSLLQGGIYADAIIDQILGKGDIRGNIVATGAGVFVEQQATDDQGNPLLNPDGTPLLERTPQFNIGSIRLTGGSIIDSAIQTTTFDQSVEGFIFAGGGMQSLEVADSFNTPFFDIGGIRLEGGGGMIGTFMFSADIGGITVENGFGVVTSRMIVPGDGVVQGINTNGLGIRDISIEGGSSVRSLIASGKGGRVPTTSYSASVRQSEAAAFDVSTGQALDPYNDLHQALGTSSRRPSVVGTSETGLIVDSRIFGSRDLGTVEAFRILGKDVIATNPFTGQKFRIAFGSADYPARFSFAGSIGNIVVQDVVNGLSLSTNRLRNFSAGGDVIYTALNVGTTLENFYAGAFRGTSSLKMTSGSGTLHNFRTKRSLFGQVVVSQDILNMTVGTDIGSPLIYASRNIKNLNVKGSTLTGASITAKKVLSNLVIGGDVQQGSTIQAGAIQKQKIGGQVLGDILII